MGVRGFYRTIFFKMCQIYSKCLKDRPADMVMHVLCSFYFYYVHRYWPNFSNPKSFSEKIFDRMLSDRSQFLTMLSDKLLVRDYVSSKVGAKYLVPLIWYGERLDNIPFHIFPNTFVIKANHGCSYNIIVKDKCHFQQNAAVIKLEQWLNENFCTDKFLGVAWAYKNIKPMILVEEFLDDGGRVPIDYKFFCYSGKASFIQMNFDRFGDAYEKFFDVDFNPLNLWQGTKQYTGKVIPPKNYQEMIRVAECLADNMDFIRVDLYNVGGCVYFGEMTCYPAGGIVRFIPRAYDFEFGSLWKRNYGLI